MAMWLSRRLETNSTAVKLKTLGLLQELLEDGVSNGHMCFSIKLNCLTAVRNGSRRPGGGARKTLPPWPVRKGSVLMHTIGGRIAGQGCQVLHRHARSEVWRPTSPDGSADGRIA